MKRRAFILALGGAAAWRSVCAQSNQVENSVGSGCWKRYLRRSTTSILTRFKEHYGTSAKSRATVKIQPDGTRFRFTRWVRHRRIPQSKISC